MTLNRNNNAIATIVIGQLSLTAFKTRYCLAWLGQCSIALSKVKLPLTTETVRQNVFTLHYCLTVGF